MRSAILITIVLIVSVSCKQGQPSTAPSSKLEARVDSLVATYLNVDTLKWRGWASQFIKVMRSSC
ncbi:MAG: hypothetical protein WDN75_01730 [Bacteroidota bacterium]